MLVTTMVASGYIRWLQPCRHCAPTRGIAVTIDNCINGPNPRIDWNSFRGKQIENRYYDSIAAIVRSGIGPIAERDHVVCITRTALNLTKQRSSATTTTRDIPRHGWPVRRPRQRNLWLPGRYRPDVLTANSRLRKFRHSKLPRSTVGTVVSDG